MKTLQQFINDLKKELPEFYQPDEAASVTEYYVCEILNLSKTELLIRKNDVLPETEILKLNQLRNRLVSGEPVQYVTEKAYFYNLEFYVDKRVLIPRQETELVVREIVNRYKYAESLNILDIGTGSGCIAVSVKRNLPQADVHVIDISAGALDVCSINAAKNEVKLCFYRHDILSENDFNPNIKFDIIVSNPPYVTESEKELMLENVVKFEPELALYVSNTDPLLFYRRITEFAVKNLAQDGTLFFEINEMFGKDVANLCKTKGFASAEIIKDLNNKDRFVIAQS